MHADVLSPRSRSVDGNSCSAGYWSRETANRHAGSNHPAVVERYTSLPPDYRRLTQGSENATVRERALESKTHIDLRRKSGITVGRSALSTGTQVLSPFLRWPKDIPTGRNKCPLQAVADCVCSPGFSRLHTNQRKKHV